MPLYEYECDQCDGRFEYLQPLNDKALKRVPGDIVGPCGKRKCKALVKKIASAPRFNKKQGQSEVITDGETGSTQVEHWDGRKDATIQQKPIKLGMKVQQ